MISRWRLNAIDGDRRAQALSADRAGRLTWGHGVVAVLCSLVVLGATAATAQGRATVADSVTTLRKRDVNGRDTVTEKVVTHRSRTDTEERVVVETYLPSLEWGGRLALRQRVQRVTTVTDHGSHTVEDMEERLPIAPSEPLRIIQRTVTTVRQSGPDAHVTERRIFRRDANGRLVLAGRQIERSSSK